MKNLLKVFKRSPSNTPRRSLRESFFRSYGLKPIRERLDLDHFTILYCQSRYDNISPIYLLYKYLQAFVMVAFLCLNMTHLDFFENNNLKWNVYLNHWSTLVSFAEAACGVFVVNYFYHHCRTKAMRSEMIISDSVNDRLIFYMYLNATSITFSTAASVLFWAFIFDKNYLTVVKVLEQGSMPFFMVLKLMVERIPFEIPFVFYPMLIQVGYFVNVLITYYVVYHNQVPTIYIFKNFNSKRPIYFLWFAIKACLMLAAIHVLLVAIFLSKRLVLRLICRNRKPVRKSRVNLSNRSVHSFTPQSRATNWMSSTDQGSTIPKPISDSKNVVRRTFDIIGYLETLHRQDFIHPEWRHYSADHPSGFYLIYRLIHMLLFITIIIFSFMEFDKILYSEYSVKYIILWIFYFGNFFLMVSLLQSVFGLVVIYKAYRRDVMQIKYYQKSDSYVTGFQKGYATIHSAATTLAIFVFVTSWQLVEDTGGAFTTLDYSYDSSHIINPLAMTLDFLVVGHAFKFKYLILSFGLLTLNIVFNYWLYSSRITSRKGNKVVYEYLNWDNTSEAITHALILLLQCISVHVILWMIFLCKRYYGVVLNRRRVLGYQVNISRTRMTVTRPPGRSTDNYSGSRIFGVYSQDNIPGSSGKKESEQSGEKSEDSETGFTQIGSDTSLSGGTDKSKSPTQSKIIDPPDQSNINTSVAEVSDPKSNEVSESKVTVTNIKALLHEKIRAISIASDPNFDKQILDSTTAQTSQNQNQGVGNKPLKSHSVNRVLSSVESLWSSATSILKHHKSKTSNSILETQHGSNNELKSAEPAHTGPTQRISSEMSGKSLSSMKPIPATEKSNVSIKAGSDKTLVEPLPREEDSHVDGSEVTQNEQSSSIAEKQHIKDGNKAAGSSVVGSTNEAKTKP